MFKHVLGLNPVKVGYDFQRKEIKLLRTDDPKDVLLVC